MNIKEIISHYAGNADHSLEYQLNDDFNQRLDDGEIDGLELILRLPDGQEQPVSSISACLFTSDLPSYRALIKKDLEFKRSEVLNVEEFPRNISAYENLLSLVTKKATIIPFVGAGFSVAAGCPSWSEYILGQAKLARMDVHEVSERLERGEHEVVMDEVIAKLTINVFQRDFMSEFQSGRICPDLSPSTELIELFDECYITTNFDRVLEDSHCGKSFAEKVVGSEVTGRFLKAIYRSEKYLLKLHGNIDAQAGRVLTGEEYDLCYGVEAIDYNLPIPRTLNRVFNNFSVLFVGCSLIADRYLTVLKESYDSAFDYMPAHFAILVAPDDIEERDMRDRYLAGCGITPIWFVDGDWDKPAQILKLLKLER
jgi:hypothetical protein